MSEHDDGVFMHLYKDFESDEAARAHENELVSALASGSKFEDNDFPANGTSLYKNQYQPPKGSPPPKDMVWLRIMSGEIADCPDPKTYVGGQKPGDVVQGSLGDCWFLSALSVLATRPALVKRLIVSDAHAKSHGIYTLKISKAGKWRYVFIDDRIPCHMNAKPLYAKSLDPNETWVMIIEKAYAKLHGTYQALVEGWCDYALRDLTGAATMKWKFDDPAIASKLKNNTLWKELFQLKEEGSLLGCSNAVDAASAGSSASVGLLSGHAYSILDMKEVHADATADFNDYDGKLIQLRNPWGQGEWNGEWSDESVLWSNYPAIKASVGKKDGKNDDGTFWMEWEAFKKHFTQIFLAVDYPDEGARVRIRGTWIPGEAKSGADGCPTQPNWQHNPQYAFDVTEVTRVVAVVSQTDTRWQAAEKYEHGIGFVVMRLPNHKSRVTKFNSQNLAGMSRKWVQDRCCAGMMTLEPGKYVIVPSTFLKSTKSVPFILEVNTDKPVKFEDVDPADMEAVEDALEEDDEEEGTPADEDHFGCVDGSACEPEETGRDIAALWAQAGELADLIKSLMAENKDLEVRIKDLEQFSTAAAK